MFEVYPWQTAVTDGGGPMPKPQTETLRPLTAAERPAQASSARVDRARRARALLAVAQGRPFA
jgi:hypothetical protein